MTIILIHEKKKEKKKRWTKACKKIYEDKQNKKKCIEDHQKFKCCNKKKGIRLQNSLFHYEKNKQNI